MAANYTFEKLLSPFDFEILVRDLISRDLEVELSIFAEGPDKGIDLRYLSTNEKKIIVQCKRTKSFNKKLMDSEKKKIEKLNPDKYYIATSHDVSVKKSDEILKAFSKWMTSDMNIYSKTRLNNLLDKYPDIQRQHYKLWINSAEIFDQFINNDLIGRSKFLLKDISSNFRFYVKNESFNEAIDILNKHHFLIISGIPGIGKTTLARVLVWEYCQKKYEIIEIRDINEGERILKEEENKKQVLYFDDFLGENFLKYDVIKGRSNDLYMFIKRIMSHKNKFLIMTTREYILKQAMEKYEKLNQQEIDWAKYTLDLNKYTQKVRALILYNHLYYSNISMDYISAIIKDKTYKKIIEHVNYSPRIIETMTINLERILPLEYHKEFLSNLDNPYRIWKNSFESQILKSSQYILYILFSTGEAILLKDLKKAFCIFLEKSAKELNLNFSFDSTKESLRELEGSFINITLTKYNEHKISFQNPSVKDYMVEAIKNDKLILKELIKSATFFNQLLYIYSNFIRGNEQNSDLSDLIINKIVIDFDKLESSRLIQWYKEENSWHVYEFTLLEKLNQLINNFDLEKMDKLKQFILNKTKNINLHNSINTSDHYYFLNIYEQLSNYINCNPYELIQSYIDTMYVPEHIENLLKLKNIWSKEFNDFVYKRKTNIDEKIKNMINDEIDNLENIEALEELSHSIEKIKNECQIDLSSENENIQYKISELNDAEQLIEEADLQYFKDNTLQQRDTVELETLFNLEMFKK